MRMYSVIAGTMASSQNCPMFFTLLLGGNVTRGGVGALAEKMPLGLLHEVLARARVGEVEAVLVHQHGLLLQPLRPRFLGNALPDALAERAGIRRKLHAFGLAAELHALHHPCHRSIICASKRPSSRASSCRAPASARAAPSRPRRGSPARGTSGRHAL